MKISSAGGEIDCVDKDGNTPLHVAARYGHELLINTLITSGADTAKWVPQVGLFVGIKCPVPGSTAAPHLLQWGG